jgi:hypothetical protein
MQLDAHAIIRAAAPDTPILFFSYMTFQNGPGALEDIAALGNGIDWNKAAVAFHGYGDRGPAAIRASLETVLDAGYPCFQTEFYRWPWATGNFELAAAGSLYQDVDETGDLERLGVSWLSFLTLRRVTEDARFKNRLNAGGVTWTPDFGTWPVPGRAVYGNGGEPRELTRSATTRIQAEHFDLGGQGVAYNDNAAANNGGALRTTDGVDIQSTSDAGGGHNIGWIVAGEWLEYTTVVRDPGLYTLRLRVASTQPANEIRVRLAGADLTGAWAFDGTGDHQAWTTISKDVNLVPGQQLLRVEALTSGFNLNWIELVPVAAGLLPNGTYRIVARHSGRAAEVAGASTSNGAKVRAADTYAAATHQRWTFTHRGANQYTIASALTGKVIDVASGTSLSGDYISLWPNSGVAFQRWIPTPTDSGFFRLVCADSGLVLDVQGGSTAAGALVQQWEWAGATQQQWSITPPFAVSIAAPDPDLGGAEGNPGRLVIARDVAHSSSLVVNLATSGSATAGVDYAALPASVTIPANASGVALNVSTISGQLPPEDRVLAVRVAAGPGYAPASSDSATLTIRAAADAFGRWVARTFSIEQQGDPLVSGPLATPFGDGVPNLIRAALNLGSGSADASLPQASAEDGHLVLRYRQLAGGTGTRGIDYTAGGLLYIVDVGTQLDPDAWQSGASVVEPVGLPQTVDDETELVAVRLKTPLAELPRAFMRLRVVRTAP